MKSCCFFLRVTLHPQPPPQLFSSADPPLRRPQHYHAHAPFSREPPPPLRPFGKRAESLPPPPAAPMLPLWWCPSPRCPSLSPLPPDLFMSLLSPEGGSGRLLRGDFMRPPPLALLPIIDEEEGGCLVADGAAAMGGGRFPGALTT